jgi:hypothetical protein
MPPANHQSHKGGQQGTKYDGQDRNRNRNLEVKKFKYKVLPLFWIDFDRSLVKND